MGPSQEFSNLTILQWLVLLNVYIFIYGIYVYVLYIYLNVLSCQLPEPVDFDVRIGNTQIVRQVPISSQFSSQFRPGHFQNW